MLFCCSIALLAHCRVPLSQIAFEKVYLKFNREDPLNVTLGLWRAGRKEPCIDSPSRWATFAGITMTGRPPVPDTPSPTEHNPIYQQPLDPCGVGDGWYLDAPEELDRSAQSVVVEIADARGQPAVVHMEIDRPFGPYEGHWGRPEDGRARVGERVWLVYTPEQASALVSLDFPRESVPLKSDGSRFHNGFIAFEVPDNLPAPTGILRVLLERDNEEVPCTGAPRCVFSSVNHGFEVPFEVIP